MTYGKVLLPAMLALALGACNASGTLSPGAQNELAVAKANVCPSLQSIETVLAADNITPTANQQLVINNLNAACNGPAVVSVAQLTAYGAAAAIVLVQLSEKKK